MSAISEQTESRVSGTMLGGYEGGDALLLHAIRNWPRGGVGLPYRNSGGTLRTKLPVELLSAAFVRLLKRLPRESLHRFSALMVRESSPIRSPV